MLAPDTSAGKWIGYQIILGVGRGLGMQMVRFSLLHIRKPITTIGRMLIFHSSLQPIIAVQNTLPPAQTAVAMALIMFSQNFGGALFLSFSETIFTNSLTTLIPEYAPSVEPQTVIDAGATGFRGSISSSVFANVLLAYFQSVDRVFYLTAGASVACFIFAWGNGWVDIRKKKEVSKA